MLATYSREALLVNQIFIDPSIAITLLQMHIAHEALEASSTRKDVHIPTSERESTEHVLNLCTYATGSARILLTWKSIS